MVAAQIAGLNCLKLMNETTAGKGQQLLIYNISQPAESVRAVTYSCYTIRNLAKNCPG